MTFPILSVDEDSTLKQVSEFMSLNKISVVLVKNKALEYIGVVTDADFTRKVAQKNYR